MTELEYITNISELNPHMARFLIRPHTYMLLCLASEIISIALSFST